MKYATSELALTKLMRPSPHRVNVMSVGACLGALVGALGELQSSSGYAGLRMPDAIGSGPRLWSKSAVGMAELKSSMIRDRFGARLWWNW